MNGSIDERIVTLLKENIKNNNYKSKEELINDPIFKTYIETVKPNDEQGIRDVKMEILSYYDEINKTKEVLDFDSVLDLENNSGSKFVEFINDNNESLILENNIGNKDAKDLILDKQNELVAKGDNVITNDIDLIMDEIKEQKIEVELIKDVKPEILNMEEQEQLAAIKESEVLSDKQIDFDPVNNLFVDAESKESFTVNENKDGNFEIKSAVLTDEIKTGVDDALIIDEVKKEDVISDVVENGTLTEEEILDFNEIQNEENIVLNDEVLSFSDDNQKETVEEQLLSPVNETKEETLEPLSLEAKEESSITSVTEQKEEVLEQSTTELKENVVESLVSPTVQQKKETLEQLLPPIVEDKEEESKNINIQESIVEEVVVQNNKANEEIKEINKYEQFTEADLKWTLDNARDKFPNEEILKMEEAYNLKNAEITNEKINENPKTLILKKEYTGFTNLLILCLTVGCGALSIFIYILLMIGV